MGAGQEPLGCRSPSEGQSGDRLVRCPGHGACAEQLLAGAEPLGTLVPARREVVFWARLSTVIARVSRSLLVEDALARGQEDLGLELVIGAPLGASIAGQWGHLPAGRSLSRGQSVASREPFTWGAHPEQAGAGAAGRAGLGAQRSG